MNTPFSLITRRLVLLLLLLIGIVPAASAVFDPVNDDTDIFLANPNIEGQRPNVLILLDNTANWSRNVGGQAIFTNEKSALTTVVNSLTDQFNLGVMMFPETGAGWTGEDGGYIRFGVRQMNTTNKSVLAGMMSGLSENGDKGNNNTVGLSLLEAYRYFAGTTNRAGWGKEKGDFDGNTANNPAASYGLGEYPLPATPNASSVYDSPIANACQKNFVIVISNGGANENASALSVSETELSTLTSSSPPDIIALDPDGQQGNWADEWARYMANNDVNASIAGDQFVYTYAVEVDPVATGQGPAMTELMESMATNGKGRYFRVTSQNGGQSIVNALNQIFQEIQAVNSVFAATTLPVSVNVRGTNLNQVYIGVFRPDPAKAPRWYGNLKCYKLGFIENDLQLVDASGAAAENQQTGFVNATASSFWTTSSSFWDFRTSDENGPGGPSDLPDGDLVEKGGVAQGLRTAYASSQAARKLYTCNDYNTTTSTTDPCVSGASLSDYAFSTTNTDINAASLLLGVKLLSDLTAEEELPVSELTDLRSITALSTANSRVQVSSLSTVSATSSVSALSTDVTRTLSALNNGAVSQGVTLAALSPSEKKWALATTTSDHGLTSGQVVAISGAAANTLYNGSWTVSVLSPTTFKYYVGTNLNSGDTGTLTTTTLSVSATTTTAHGFSSGQTVTIAGVTPTGFNGSYFITVTSPTTFSFTTPTAIAPATVMGTVSGSTTTATATASAHGFLDGDSVTIAGATPTGYNGAHTITVIDANTFTYTVPAGLSAASGTVTATKGSSVVSATTALPHGFVDGQVVTLTGANPLGYNGSFPVTVVDTTHFEYDAGQVLTPNTGSPVYAWSGTSNIAWAWAPNHHFRTGDVVTISGAIPTDYNGSYTIAVLDSDTFAYALTTTPPGTSGTITAKRTSPTAYVTLAGHGFSVGDSVTIRGADPTGFNGTYTVASVDGDTFTYSLTAAVDGSDAGTAVVVKNTTTARARAIGHGYVTGDSVVISGATQSTFNGTFTITRVDDDNFTYTLPSAQGAASGAIVAQESGGGTATAADVENLINWVRGQDNFEDENIDSVLTDVRASTHGDVLHARPAVINYNRFGDDNDVFVFYGSNDGIFRAVKGGFDSTTGQPAPGAEAWGFIPKEFFGKLKRLRNNEPLISSANKKPYFADGSIGTYVEDIDNDNQLESTDKVYLYLSMRRGGRMIYALDVSDPLAPKLLWKKDQDDLSFDMGLTHGVRKELGFTWSLPKVVTDLRATSDPVLIFGAGYDPTVEDVPPDTITSFTASGVSDGTDSYLRGMGRGVFVLNALTGAVIWQAGPELPTGASVPSYYLEVPGMDYAIPSDVSVIHSQSSPTYSDRAYVGDTGGNVWRFDIGDANTANWKVTKLASVGDHSTASGLRKFLFAPDVVYADGYDAILLGSGDREHPFDETVINRMYMFKDTATGSSAFDPEGARVQSVTLEGAMFDSSNAIGTTIELGTAMGWYITLGTGEKVVSNAVTLNEVTFFNTNQPSSQAPEGSCASDLGIARQYQVNYRTATSIRGDGVAERAAIHPGGGYLPSPVPVVVEIDGQIHEGVISGVRVDEPPGSALNARIRRFWYKEGGD